MALRWFYLMVFLNAVISRFPLTRLIHEVGLKTKMASGFLL